MFYTITFAPSIDYVINSNKKININTLNRIEEYDFFPGGKGINASIILERLGFKNKAFCFSGGITNSFFDSLLKKENINFLNIKTNDNTRINIKCYDGKNQFEINGPSPKLSNAEFEFLEKQLSKLNTNDTVFIMGKCKDEYLVKIIKEFSKRKIKFVLDIDSSILLDLLKFKPFVIKPNIYELEMLLNRKIGSEKEIYDAMLFLKNNGSKNTIVSCGSKGSYLLTNDNSFFKISFPKIDNVVSTVGAGDTLIAAFTALLIETNKYIDSIKKATSLSIGTCCRRWLGIKEDVNKYFDLINVVKINF